MKKKCAIYARYSSDRQSPASIDDQLRKCREFAAEKGLEVVEEHVYTDEAASGAGTDRRGLIKLKKAALESPCPFEVLLTDDTSRLHRNLGESMQFIEEMKFRKIRVIAVSQGVDTDSDQAEVVLTFHGLSDSIYIKELAKKTHRGLEGKALKGEHTGGRCFGYDNVRADNDKVRLEINETEAAIVRRMFEMAANGVSLKGITKTFNSEHIPPPRKRKGKSDGTWCHNAIREMLRNELYIGRQIWNRSKFIKRPGTNKRVRTERPKSDWLITEKPELRIIDQQLWDRVQDRIAFVQQHYNFGNKPGLAPKAFTSPNLLTGLMKCGSCGANLIIVSGRGKLNHPRYGCPQNFNRGACTNGVKERADALEEMLFAELQNAVLQPEAIDFAIQEFERQLKTSLAGLDGKIGRMRERSQKLQQELGNLIPALASCGPSPTLVEAINSREQEIKEITRQLLGTEEDSISTEVGRIRQFVTGQLGGVRQLLQVDVQRAKAELQKHVTEIRMVPQSEGKKGFYVAEGEWDLLGGYRDRASGKPTQHFRMVAGA